MSRTGANAGKETGRGRYVTMWRRDGGRWLVIMDTGYPEPPTSALASRRGKKKPRTLSGTGLATGGPPVLQARPVALILAGRRDNNAGPQLLRLTVRRNGLKDSFWVWGRSGPPQECAVELAVSALPGRSQRQVAGRREKCSTAARRQRRHSFPVQ